MENKLFIDLGSSTIRIGIAGEDEPRVKLPNVVGKNRQSAAEEQFCGQEAITQSTSTTALELITPKTRERIDSDSLEYILHHSITKLGFEPQDFDFGFSEPILGSRKEREQIAQIVFEKFNAKGISFTYDPVLTLYASGRTTGLALNVGHSYSQVLGITDGLACQETAVRVPFAGIELSRALHKQLVENVNYQFKGSGDWQLFEATSIKETVARVAGSSDSVQSDHSLFSLPDGSSISGATCAKIGEILFTPKDYGYKSFPSIATLVCDAMDKSFSAMKNDWIRNIVLSGSTTFLQGFPERLKKEIQSIASPLSDKVQVVSPKEREISVWIGGSIELSLSSYDQNKCISKFSYNSDPGIIRRTSDCV